MITLLIFLVVLFAVTFAKVLAFAIVDQTPPHWDYAGHLSNTIDYMVAIKGLNIQEVFLIYRFYPPIVYFLMSIFFILLGYSEGATVIFNFSLLILLLAGVYWFVYKVSDRLVSAGATLFVFALVLAPGSINVKLWEFMLDFPQAVIIVLTYCLYYYSIKQKRFTFRRALILGIVTALALLIKWTAVVFVVIPFVFYSFTAVKHQRIRAALLLIGVVALLAGNWYLFHWFELYPNLYFFANQEGILNQDPQGIIGLIYYFEKMGEALGWSFLLLGYAMWRSVILLFNVVKRKEKILVSFSDLFDVAFILLPIFIFSFLIQNKNERYLFPIYILLPLIMFIQIIKNNPNTKIFLLVGTLCFAIYRITYYVPKPYTEKNALTTMQEILSTYSPTGVAYFFEDDTSFFNYSNATLFHKELSDFRGQYVPYFYLNNHAQQHTKNQCVLVEPVDIVIVYSGWGHILEPFSQHVSYSERCVQLSDCYQPARVYDFSNERLRVYERRSACATEAQ